MSDTERLSLRDLPPVEPVAPPSRFSQTLLAKANSCRRSAYLYQRYRGGTPGRELDFGSAFHFFAERAIRDMVVTGNTTLYAAQEGDPDSADPLERMGEDPAMAARAVGSLTASMCDEVLAEHPELTLPLTGDYSRDKLRECAYHFAVTNPVSIPDVVGIEQKFVLDLDCGVTISGKVDVVTISLADPRIGGVDDHKSSMHIPAQGDFEEKFQLPLYGLLLCFGVPVETIVCPDCNGDTGDEEHGCPCATCETRGTVERRLPSLGEQVQWVRARELYPRPKPRDDGEMHQREVLLSRQRLANFRHDVEALAVEMLQRFAMIPAEETTLAWKFPAISGSHCSECPCQPECPLPEQLRRHAGTINTVEEASEAAEWVARVAGWQGHPGGEVTATKKEITNFAKAHGPIPYGTDRVLEFADPQTSHETDWPGLMLAVDDAVRYGEPFNWSDHRKQRVSTPFRSRRLTAEELAAEANHETEVQDGERDFGDDPPF